MNEVDPKALFRLSVLGPLVSRERLARGELQQLIRELSARELRISANVTGDSGNVTDLGLGAGLRG